MCIAASDGARMQSRAPEGGDEMADELAMDDYRIGEGGPLRRFEVATHLTRLHWQIAALLGVTWAPLAALGLWTGDPNALIRDPTVHVRSLIAGPLLLFLDQLFPSVCRYTLAQLRDKAFVPSTDRPRFERLLGGACRLADSTAPEAMLALISLGVGVAALAGLVPESRLTASAGVAPDRVWYALCDLPVFQFLLWRSFWRWAIWVGVLAGLSRIDLDLVPTHPDLRGGIRFLSLPSIGYCAALLFVASSLLCAEWGTRRTLGATLASFKPLLLVFATGGTLIAFGPLLLFMPQLFRARHRGILEMSSLSIDCGRRLRSALNDRARVVRNDDVHALASAEQTYRQTVKQLSLFLFDKRDLGLLLAATLLPLVPVMLLHIPREDWQELAILVMGWVP